jgi:hypothetical protein
MKGSYAHVTILRRGPASGFAGKRMCDALPRSRPPETSRKAAAPDRSKRCGEPARAESRAPTRRASAGGRKSATLDQFAPILLVTSSTCSAATPRAKRRRQLGWIRHGQELGDLHAGDDTLSTSLLVSRAEIWARRKWFSAAPTCSSLREGTLHVLHEVLGHLL